MELHSKLTCLINENKLDLVTMFKSYPDNSKLAEELGIRINQYLPDASVEYAQANSNNSHFKVEVHSEVEYKKRYAWLIFTRSGNAWVTDCPSVE